MTIATHITSPEGSPSLAVIYVVDATAGNETVSLPLATDAQSNGWPPFEKVTVIKKDASANTVTVQDATPTSLGVLEFENDSMSFFDDGLVWRVESNASATDVSTHAALTTAHGSTGDVMGETSVDLKDVAAVLHPTTDYVVDALTHRVLDFIPAAGTPVNNVYITNSATGDPCEIGATGTDSNIDLTLVPNGTGVVTEKGTPIAIQAAAQADSTALDIVELVTDFNALLAKLRTGRTLAP